MSETLFINACVRENSRTLELSKYVLDMLGGETEEIRLYEAGLLPLDVEGITARERSFRAGDFSDDRFVFAKQFAAAKTIVIAAPYWDLMFPAVLKTYLEAVTVSGLTFAYSEKGIPTGLCNAERLIYIMTAGGPVIDNLGYEYVRALAGSFYGIKNVMCISAEGLDIHGADVNAIMQKAKAAAAAELEKHLR